MLLTRSGEYALRALIFIADHGETRPVRTVEIAASLGVPRNYLSKLLYQLARAGVLRSERGPRGGFSLDAPAERLSLARVLAPVEAEWLDQSCLLGRAPCDEVQPCPIHDDWMRLRERIEQFLQETTIASLRRSGGGRGDIP